MDGPGGGSAPRLASTPALIDWIGDEATGADEWESAYDRYETPSQEIAKFKRRYRSFGVGAWNRDSRILELFCGHGNGLKALEQMGFRQLAGADFSRAMLGQYDGPAQLYRGDCRQVRLPDRSVDAVVIQGGLHHLPNLPEDLDKVLGEAHRLLRAEGRLLVVEPWQTPFLGAVHGLCKLQVLRRLSSRVDALAKMIDQEEETYFRWLAQPDKITAAIERIFVPLHCRTRWGKLWFLGSPRA